MDIIHQINEALNPGGNPVIFYLVAGVLCIFLIMVLRSILHIVMIMVGVGLIAVAVAYYNGYDFSQWQLPEFWEASTSGNTEAGTASHTQNGNEGAHNHDNAQRAPAEENTFGNAVKESLPDFDDMLGDAFRNFRQAIENVVKNLRQ